MTDKDIEMQAKAAGSTKNEKDFLQDMMKANRDADGGQASATSLKDEAAAAAAGVQSKVNASIDGLPKTEDYKDPIN